jgi:LPXTG-motif cell wall-anchored protein
MGSSEVNVNMVAVLFVIAGLLALLTAAVFLLRNRKRKENDISDVLEEMAQRNYSSGEWLQISQAHAEKSAWRDAVRYRYMAGLAALHEKRIIMIHTAMTNGQIARELDDKVPVLAPSFAYITACFHRAWFGNKPTDGYGFIKFSEAVDDIIR